MTLYWNIFFQLYSENKTPISNNDNKKSPVYIFLSPQDYVIFRE
jgi:hypothetical protein